MCVFGGGVGGANVMHRACVSHTWSKINIQLSVSYKYKYTTYMYIQYHVHTVHTVHSVYYTANNLTVHIYICSSYKIHL